MSNSGHIRVFRHNGFPPGDGLPESGEFVGTVCFADISQFYVDHKNPAYLTIILRGEGNDGVNSWLSALRSDVHMLEPSLAATFPLTSD